MEIDVGVKVTRLRRRLSVEQSEDGGSPAPSTPTKKRGGRLAAKPQLELIDENGQVSSPRKTRRKSLATDTEEKPITPSRRSARIKSNSSIVSETLSVQLTDSPRAKRAARRNSQAGSDNDGPATPVTQTRRTRRDSASSLENADSSTLIKPLPVAAMVIEEEPENEFQKEVNKSKSSPTAADAEKLSPNSQRKSKRLSEKRNRRSGSYKTDQESATTIENKSLNISTTDEKTETESQDSPSNKSIKSKESNEVLSESNVSLLKDVVIVLNKSNHNKSTSALDTTENDKSKRTRTESWPVITASDKNDSIIFSDSERSKKNKEKSDKITTDFIVTDPNIDKSNTIKSTKIKKTKIGTNIEDNAEPSGGGNTLQVLTPKEDSFSSKEIGIDKSDKSDVTRDITNLFENAPDDVQAIVYLEDSDSNSVGASTLNKIEHLDSEDQCVPVVNHDFQENLSTKELGGNSTTENNVLSNQVSKENVPNADISIPKKVSDDINNSCEPMDIDETIHEELLQKSIDASQQSNKSLKLKDQSIVEETGNPKRKSSISNSSANISDLSKNNTRKISISNSGTNTPDLTKKDKRKSSITSSGTDTPDRSKNDNRKSSISNSSAGTPDISKNNTNNKSTLILSQLKDVSSTAENLKSPKLATNEVLSKSDINEKGKDKNKKVSKGNLSLNDVKGTPKQTIQLTMQTSTPITTQQIPKGSKSKIEEQRQEGAKKNKSNFSKSINDTDSSEEDSDDNDEPSVEKNELIDDEAEEANDDYESGDSQDDEERRYEEDNEIVIRGETLTSDDDMSNDTDYEKDSFIVSSCGEDNELLSGSGDDLSMSDNELTMSKKSKKKFNERKVKEQKNASREMFESRHKLNTADQKSPTPKTKKNRMRIDSSLLGSDEDVVVNPKKTNRMRLNSTLDASDKLEESNEALGKGNVNKSKQDSALDTSERQVDTNVSLKKKNKKSMQESICDKITADEKEITVCSESTTMDTDPLQVHVKQEPKTPQKGLNMSVVQFTDRQEIENVQVTECNSIFNQTGTDPLHTTMASENTSDSSENEEILQNYDSVLNELNKDNKTNFNKKDVSLNMGNKTKKNQVEPIIDQLNLTSTKKSRKNKDHAEDVSESKTLMVSKEKQESGDEDSSNSIDLQLLFSEDNGSDEEQMSQENKVDEDNMFIPLKKTPGKTNIRESIGINTSQQDTSLNESDKKRKKRKSSLGPAQSVEQEEMNTSDQDVNLNESTKKKHKRKSSLVPSTVVDEKDVLNVSKNASMNESSIKNKKKHSISEAPVEKSKDTLNVSKNVNISMNESGIKKKKKHSISETPVEEPQDDLHISKNVNISLNESGIKKKKKHSISETPVEETQDTLNISKNVNISTNDSGMKKKKHSISETPMEKPQDVLNISLNESGIKKKKKHSISEMPVEEPQDVLNISKNVNISLNESGMRKKKKHSISETPLEEPQAILNISKNGNISLNESGMKKKKKHSISETPVEEPQDVLNISKNVNVSVNESRMKKKKKHSISETPVEELQVNLNISKNVNVSMNESGMKKKKKHSISETPVEEPQDNLNVSKNVNISLNESSIKKKKHSISETPVEESQGDLFFIDTTGNLQDNKDHLGELEDQPLNVVYESKKKKKKNKFKIDQDENEQNDSKKNKFEESNPPITPKSAKKKKKQKVESLVRDDDSDGAPDEAPYQSEKASELDLHNTESASESAESAKKKHKKKKKKSASASNQSGENIDTENITQSNSKKRKRKTSNAENSQESGDAQESVETGKHNELVGSNKKRKISHNEDNNTLGSSESNNVKKNKKKNRDVKFQDTAVTSETTETRVKKNKKRKYREDDDDNKQTKVKKDSSFQEVHVPRLPDNILQQLDDEPRKIQPARAISTSNFIVENARQKRAKPSNYLEESIYLDEKSPLVKKQKQRIKKPKVLPFIPTASISEIGYTTNFKIDKLSHTTTFEAVPVVFSKETYLQKKNIKRLGTYDRYKKQMHHKMSKF